MSGQERTLSDLRPGESCYSLPWGLHNAVGKWWLHPNYPADAVIGGTIQMQVKRTGDRYTAWPVNHDDFPDGARVKVAGLAPFGGPREEDQMIVWDDGVTSGTAAGEERGLRRQRERAVAELVKAARIRRLCRIGAWLVWALLVVTVVDALLWSDLPGSLFRVAMACVIVGIAEGVFVPSTIGTAARCRVKLDRVQRDYDKAFARMLAEEQ